MATSSSRTHDFQLSYFNKPTFCALCTEFIWGVFEKQGYTCKVCRYPVHKKCKARVPETCGLPWATKTDRFKDDSAGVGAGVGSGSGSSPHDLRGASVATPLVSTSSLGAFDLSTQLSLGDAGASSADVSPRNSDDGAAGESSEALWQMSSPFPREIPRSRDDLKQLCAPADGYSIEAGSSDAPEEPEDFYLEDIEKDVTFFQNFFAERPGFTLVAQDADLGPIIVSFEERKGKTTRCLVRTSRGDDRLDVSGKEEKEKLKALCAKVPKYYGVQFTRCVTDSFIIAQLQQFEEKLLVQRYKFGLLYLAPGQCSEAEMYNNTTTSAAYEQFLLQCGERVELEGWQKYRAGMDVSEKRLHGEHSIYTTCLDYEIMFHVATLIPANPADPQQLERKRHLGNDLVLIVFTESEHPFNPTWMASQFNHSFIVVSPDRTDDGELAYRVAVTNKFGVKPNRPFIPDPPLFKPGADFHEFLIRKLVNSERAVMYAPDFRGKKSTTRKAMLNSILKSDEIKRLKSYTIKDPNDK